MKTEPQKMTKEERDAQTAREKEIRRQLIRDQMLIPADPKEIEAANASVAQS